MGTRRSMSTLVHCKKNNNLQVAFIGPAYLADCHCHFLVKQAHRNLCSKGCGTLIWRAV